MDIEEHYQHKKAAKKIRIKITTNRNMQFITAIRPEATISELANRALSAYLELCDEAGMQSTSKKQLTVSAVKQGVFYMPKSECVSNLLNQDDQVEVVIIKAKPKYPHKVVSPQVQQERKEVKNSKMIIARQNKDKKQKIVNAAKQDLIIERISAVSVLEDRHGRQEQRDISKRQKKKEKKKERFQKKKKFIEQHQQKQKMQIFKRQISPQLKENQTKQRQLFNQSMPKKKIKLQKQQILNSSQKTPIVVPSPKITFHPDPKIDSPRISLLSQSQKKKFNFQLVNKTSQNVYRKSSQDIQKRNTFQKIVSPIGQIKSPFMSQKNTAQNPTINQTAKQKEKQQLSSFSLIRKGSEDKKTEPKKDKNKDEVSSIKQKNDPAKDTKEENILKPSPDKTLDKLKQKNQQKKIPNNQQSKTVEKVVSIKASKSLVIQQSQSDSQSQQNKKTHQNPVPSHRNKQLTQIDNMINSFRFQPEEED